MPPVQPALLLSFIKRLKIFSDRLLKFGIRRGLLLRNFFRTCLSPFIGCFRQSSGSRHSIPWDKANHDSHQVFDNVHCFSRFPTTILDRWKRSQSLPLYHAEHYSPEPQMGPSTSQAVAMPCSTTPTNNMMMSPVSTSAEDDHNRDPPLPPGLSNEVEKLVAVTSCEFERYERNFKSEKLFYESIAIHPLLMTFTEPNPPNQWVACTHPDGALYFHDNSRAIPILTDVWLYDKASNDKLEVYIEQIFSYINKYEIEIPVEVWLVLEFRNTGKCGYYFANHAKQCLFWLDEFNGMDFLYEVQVAYTPSLVGHEMKALYWRHNHLFPNIRGLPPYAIPEVKDILVHLVGDLLTSERGMAPYSLEVLQKMLNLVNNIEAQDQLAPGSIAIISRFLQNFYHERFLNLHGQKLARLNRDQSIHPERRRTHLMTVISPFLLYGPEVYLKKLREITIDCLVNSPVWKDVLQQLTADWKEFTLYATVLLNANVAFLAIQSVDSSATVGHRSNAQRASYFSIVTSVGAIVLGLLLVRQHNTSLNLSFIANRSASEYGLETLALMYSLPYALLMWGTISFLAAFSIMCFSSQDQVITVMMSVTWFTLCSLLLWCISVSYESQPFWYPWPFRQWGWFKDSIKEGITVGKGIIMPHLVHDTSEKQTPPEP